MTKQQMKYHDLDESTLLINNKSTKKMIKKEILREDGNYDIVIGILADTKEKAREDMRIAYCGATRQKLSDVTIIKKAFGLLHYLRLTDGTEIPLLHGYDKTMKQQGVAIEFICDKDTKCKLNWPKTSIQ